MIMRKVAILQPNYLPWKGVFDMIHQVDVFVFYDDVQYTRQDWRNRNMIQTQSGPIWVTVPVNYQFHSLIKDVAISDTQEWQKKHYYAFKTNYGRAPYFKEYEWLLDELYLKRKWKWISELDIFSTKLICDVLGIKKEFVLSSELELRGTADDRVLDVVKKLKGDHYLSGPAAKSYISNEKFAQNGIALEYIKYEYPEYKQVFEPFCHGVTILDLIFNCGKDAPRYIWGDRPGLGGNL